ncbi:unnamed protein product [Brachionus calyciflorus]|uniref:Uncharacterized protein n=1 Tax=Brachionus calyciflorus TaxID=104777 RepID=A0A813VSX0_9BILA|nr:unnamed protein product [Brachionus calyciflorus]
MATTSQREALKGTESSWTTEQKNRLLSECDANLKRIRELQLEGAVRSYMFDGRSTENIENWISIISNSIKAARTENLRLGDSNENERISRSDEEKAYVVSLLAESNNLLMTEGFVEKKRDKKNSF